jgi:hypothetical protein
MHAVHASPSEIKHKTCLSKPFGTKLDATPEPLIVEQWTGSHRETFTKRAALLRVLHKSVMGFRCRGRESQRGSWGDYLRVISYSV